MRCLIVLAHPEPGSFTAALARTAAEALAEAGHEVELDDLHAEGFQPVAGRGDVTHEVPEHFSLMTEQARASRDGTFAADVAREIERVRRADLLLLVFPVWWFAMPAMLKGWVDRVFANGFAYELGRPPYASGPLAGKRALIVVTTGYDGEYREGGVSGDLLTLLHPIQHGTLRYTGMDVLAPFVAWGADEVDDDRRAAYLHELRRRMAGIHGERPVDLPPAPPIA